MKKYELARPTISLRENYYNEALQICEEEEITFSRYIRELVKADLKKRRQENENEKDASLNASLNITHNTCEPHIQKGGKTYVQ